MIKYLSLLSFYLMLFASGTAQAQMDVMTYNLRYATESDGENAWSKRKADVAALIAYYRPAVLGVQEALLEQMQYVDSSFSAYTYVGVGRDDGVTQGEYSAIFYDTTLLKAIASETFWLSETPHKPSYGWGANFRRVCTYGAFLNLASGDTLHVFNTHFDHEVELARLNAAQVILDKVVALGLLEKQVVLMGDFNCTLTDPPMKRLQSQFEFGAERTSSPPYGPSGTFNGFEILEQRTLDHILVRNSPVKAYRHIDDRRPNGGWPSDHLPVTATIQSF